MDKLNSSIRVTEREHESSEKLQLIPSSIDDNRKFPKKFNFDNLEFSFQAAKKFQPQTSLTTNEFSDKFHLSAESTVTKFSCVFKLLHRQEHSDAFDPQTFFTDAVQTQMCFKLKVPHENLQTLCPNFLIDDMKAPGLPRGGATSHSKHHTTPNKQKTASTLFSFTSTSASQESCGPRC
jgi:hypothetical protein